MTAELIQISVGQFKFRTQARPLVAANIGEALKSIHGPEAWYSLHTWSNGHRKIEHWLSAVGVSLDVDYHDGAGLKAVPSHEERERLAQVLAQHQVCSVWHSTPHGVRILWQFTSLVTDKTLYLNAQSGAAAIARDVLRDAGVLAERMVRTAAGKVTAAGGFFVDPAAQDLAHFMWAPNTTVDGVQREAEVVCFDVPPFDVEALAALASEDAVTFDGSDASGIAVQDDDEISAMLLKLPADGANDGSEACIRCARRAVGLGVETAEQFVRVAARWNDKRSKPWSEDELARRFRDALARWDAEGRAKVPVGRYTVPALAKILRDDREYKDRLVFDVTEQLARRDMDLVNDVGVTKIRADICERYGYATLPREDLRDAIAAESSKRVYDPVASYLAGLVWDGEPRMYRLTELLRPKTPSFELAHLYVVKTLIAALDRRAHPGCKADCSFVLVGSEGSRKSTFFRVLAGDANFQDTKIDLTNKDAYGQIAKAWIYEWGELESVTRKTDLADVKRFMSSTKDTYRTPYGRTTEAHPRRGIIVGTSNSYGILNDPESDRRFWVLEVGGQIDTDWLEDNRDQVWAEAIALREAGEVCFLSDYHEEERRKANADFHQDSPMTELIQIALEHFEKQPDFGGHISSLALYRKIGVDPVRGEKRIVSEISSILGRFGWRKRHTEKGQVWVKE